MNESRRINGQDHETLERFLGNAVKDPSSVFLARAMLDQQPMTDPSTVWIRRILLATDFSPGAGMAMDYAAQLARVYRGDVLLLHVSQPYPTLSADAVSDTALLEPVRQEVLHALENLARHYAESGIRASARQTVGIASQEIVRVATEEDVDVIAMGTRGRTGLDDVLLGSTAERVVKGAPCPVITVPCGIDSAGQGLLVPFDFFEASLDALETAVLLARDFHVPILLLHVLEWAWLRQQFSLTDLADDVHVRSDIEARLDRYAERIRAEGVEAERLVRGGAGPVDHIVETAAERHAGLIVMGTHGKRGVQRALMGSVAEGVLRRAACPVLTVKTRRFPLGHRRVFDAVEKAA
jgi:nucleotide-binding universal stress UspA family protein